MDSIGDTRRADTDDGGQADLLDASGRDDALVLTLVVTDSEVVEALNEQPDARSRSTMALTALKIGVLSMRAARGNVDAATVRNESERLLSLLAERLSNHQESVAQIVGTALGRYFDPRNGQFSERVMRLVADDGELSTVIGRRLGEASALLDRTLMDHLGPNSALMGMLTPAEGNAFIARVKEVVDERTKVQADAVLSQFSLDNRDSALNRLLRELTEKHGSLQDFVSNKISVAMAEFSLDSEDSALSRLVAQVRQGQERISWEFSLDRQDSALSRIATTMQQSFERQETASREFQTRVLTLLDRLDTRRAEMDRSTTHGTLFEERVGSVLRQMAEKKGDVLEAVGATPGVIARCKTGDFVLSLPPDSQAAGARIVIEAKEDKAYSIGSTLQEADEARRNRNAGYGVFVHSSKTAGEGIPVFERFGRDIVVVWDADDPGTDVRISAAITTAKALSVRAAAHSKKEAASVQKIDRAIEGLKKQVETFNEITTASNTITQSADRIRSRTGILMSEIGRLVDILEVNIKRLADDEAAG